MFVLAHLTIFIIIFVYYYYEIAKLISFQLTIKNLTMTIISRMRLWDPFDLHNSRPATAAVRYMARDWSNLFSELILTDYDKMRLNLQFLPTNRVGRRGSGIVAFIKIDSYVCMCSVLSNIPFVWAALWLWNAAKADRSRSIPGALKGGSMIKAL